MQKRLPGEFTEISILILLLSLTSCFDLSGQKAIIKKIQPVLTYPFSDPNPVPAMAVSSMVSPILSVLCI